MISKVIENRFDDVFVVSMPQSMPLMNNNSIKRTCDLSWSITHANVKRYVRSADQSMECAKVNSSTHRLIVSKSIYNRQQSAHFNSIWIMRRVNGAFSIHVKRWLAFRTSLKLSACWDSIDLSKKKGMERNNLKLIKINNCEQCLLIDYKHALCVYRFFSISVVIFVNMSNKSPYSPLFANDVFAHQLL